jgi:hypothetical protein
VALKQVDRFEPKPRGVIWKRLPHLRTNVGGENSEKDEDAANDARRRARKRSPEQCC